MIDKIEKVDHPSHYLGKKYEAIDIIEDYGLGFSLGNAVKYILRAGKKDNAIEDLEKAAWYISREIFRLKASACGEELSDSAKKYLFSAAEDSAKAVRKMHADEEQTEKNSYIYNN